MSGARACRVCGCTDNRACPPHGCYWVEADLCSACRPPTPRRKLRQAIPDALRNSILDGWAGGAALGTLAEAVQRPAGTINSVVFAARRSGDPRASYRQQPRRRMTGHV